MKNNFVFKPVEQTFSDPVAAVFRPGIPYGREYCKGDIVLLNPEISSSKIFLNSKILREAILESKDYIEKVLNLEIKDKAVSENPVEEKKSTKGKAKKDKEVPKEAPVLEDLAYEEEELIKENTEVTEETTEETESVMDEPIE